MYHTQWLNYLLHLRVGYDLPLYALEFLQMVIDLSCNLTKHQNLVYQFFHYPIVSVWFHHPDTVEVCPVFSRCLGGSIIIFFILCF